MFVLVRENIKLENFHKKKFIVSFVLIMVACIILLCSFLSWNEMRVTKVDVSNIPELSLDNDVKLNLDNAYYQKDALVGTQIVIDGWCIIEGQETNPIVIHVLLKDMNRNIYYKLPSVVKIRDDVTEYLDDGTDYGYSGFGAFFNYSGFDFESTSYEIVLLYEVNDEAYLIPSGHTISEKKETDDEK